MQIVPFPAYYQSVYTNFDFTSFSLISCITKVVVLRGKNGSFASQNSRFRNIKAQLSLFDMLIFTKPKGVFGILFR